MSVLRELPVPAYQWHGPAVLLTDHHAYTASTCMALLMPIHAGTATPLPHACCTCVMTLPISNGCPWLPTYAHVIYRAHALSCTCVMTLPISNGCPWLPTYTHVIYRAYAHALSRTCVMTLPILKPAMPSHAFLAPSRWSLSSRPAMKSSARSGSSTPPFFSSRCLQCREDQLGHELHV